MTKRHLLPLFGLVLACGMLPLAATAQTAPAASAPPLNKTVPRALSPAEKRDSASVPGDVRPADAVIPQINLPLGRTPPGNTPATKGEAQRQRQAASNGGVDDGVARCKAQTTVAARRECLDLQSRVGKKP
jgi:hypothetical protein